MVISIIIMLNQIYNSQKHQQDDFYLNDLSIKRLNNSFESTYDNNYYVSAKNESIYSSYFDVPVERIILENPETKEIQNQLEKIRRSETYAKSLEPASKSQQKSHTFVDNVLVNSDCSNLQSADYYLSYGNTFQNVFESDKNSIKGSVVEGTKEKILYCENLNNQTGFKINNDNNAVTYTNNIANENMYTISFGNKNSLSFKKSINIFEQDLSRPGLLQSGNDHCNFIESFRNDNRKNTISLLEFIETLHSDVEQYIKYYIRAEYQEIYLKRLTDIADFLHSFDENKRCCKEKNYVFSDYGKKVEEKLYLIYTEIGFGLMISNENFNISYEKFNLAMSKIAKFYHRKWTKRSRTEKNLTFQYEFIKLYKIACKTPEIMTLLNDLKGQLCFDTTFIIYLTNVFIEKMRYLDNGNFFIKFLLNRALKFTNSKYHAIKSYAVESNEIHCDFNFFTKEINVLIRKGIKERTGKIFLRGAEFTFHTKIILLLFLYHHSISLRSYYISVEDINAYRDLVERVILSNDFFICIIQEFLGLIQRQGFYRQ